MKPQVPILLLLLVGVALLIYSLTLSVYTNQPAADKLLAGRWNMSKADYYKEEAALRTNKLILMDVGSGLTVACLTVALFLYYTGVRHFSDFFRLQTPRKTTIFIASNLVWLLMVPGTWWYYAFRLSRGDYPPFADSVGIPIGAQVPVFLWCLLPLNVFLLVTTSKSKLPALLFKKALKYSKMIVFWEVFFGFCFLINVLLLGSFLIDGDHFSVVITLFFSYTLFCLRAGKIKQIAVM